MSKYFSRKTEIDGHTFDSLKEASRYTELKLLERGKVIKDLKLQPVYELQPRFRYHGSNIRAITYVADFSYTDAKTGKTVVEDVKGFKTEVYKLKRKIFLYQNPEVDFREI